MNKVMRRLFSRLSTYDKCLYGVVLAGGTAASAFIQMDLRTHRTITAKTEAVDYQCRDEMRNQAKVQVCAGTIMTDKRWINVDWDQGVNAFKTLRKGQTYTFKVKGLGHTARPVLADMPDNIRLVNR